MESRPNVQRKMCKGFFHAKEMEKLMLHVRARAGRHQHKENDRRSTEGEVSKVSFSARLMEKVN